MVHRSRSDRAQGAEAGHNHRRDPADRLVYTSFPNEHRAKLHRTNPIERLNGEIERRIRVIGIFLNDEAIVRLAGALLPEQNDERAVQRARDLTLETIALLRDGSFIRRPTAAS